MVTFIYMQIKMSYEKKEFIKRHIAYFIVFAQLNSGGSEYHTFRPAEGLIRRKR
jgi:hypothetical protein